MFYKAKWIRDLIKLLRSYFEDVSEEEMNEFDEYSLWLRYEET